MLRILERGYKQSSIDIRNEFPNSEFVMRVDDLLDEEGYLLAVSTSRDSADEFSEYLRSHRYMKYLYTGGFYERSVGYGLYELNE